jgi:hypothetical protein
MDPHQLERHIRETLGPGFTASTVKRLARLYGASRDEGDTPQAAMFRLTVEIRRLKLDRRPRPDWGIT